MEMTLKSSVALDPFIVHNRIEKVVPIITVVNLTFQWASQKTSSNKRLDCYVIVMVLDL